MDWWGVFTELFPQDDSWVFSHPESSGSCYFQERMAFDGSAGNTWCRSLHLELSEGEGKKSHGHPCGKPDRKHGREPDLPAPASSWEALTPP